MELWEEWELREEEEGGGGVGMTEIFCNFAVGFI